MLKKLLTGVFLFLTLWTTWAQPRESQTLIKRLVHDNDLLSIMLDSRFDMRGDFHDYDTDEWGFKAQTLKLWIAGEIAPGIRYRVRHRLNKSPQFPRDGFSSATDHAWIAFDFKKNWTVTVGKQSVQFGTFEYDYGTGDIYLSTMCNSDLDNYKAGVNLARRIGKQTINLQIVNSDSPQFASDKWSKRAMALNFLWEGNFWDGFVKTRWGYGVFMHTGTKYYNWITPGIQINSGHFTTELDYYFGYRDMDYSSLIMDPDQPGERYVRDQSASVNLKLDFGKWKPFVKGTWNQRFDKDMRRQAYQSWGIQAVAEFHPFTNPLLKDLRFHAAYLYSETVFMGNYRSLDDRGTHTALLGMRWLFKAK